MFRSGIVEAVEGYIIRLAAQFGGEDEVIQGYPFERTIIDGVSRYMQVQSRVGAEPPIVVMVTVSGVRGYRIQTGAQGEDLLARREGGAVRFDRDLLLLPDVLIDTFDADVPRALRPVFDSFWQAGGKMRSQNYDENGGSGATSRPDARRASAPSRVARSPCLRALQPR